MPLTDKQSAVLEYIRERRTEGFAMPTVREIQQRFGFSSPFAATRHIMALERKGFLNRAGGRARSMILNDAPTPRWLNIPLLGAIPAGLPVDAVEQSDRFLTVDADSLRLPKNSRPFALEVRGDSMIDGGILDRDIVILELAEPRHRDIVAALIDGESTLKRYLVQNDRPFLRAENPKYPDLIPAHELVIQGVFRALIRINHQN
ncbi:MAG: transcriptional repressor LexA [Terrimicrobiaceae bacterium]|nr:transcriptional repressor LexA [Terrimicrobiaceae bacterium]